MLLRISKQSIMVLLKYTSVFALSHLAQTLGIIEHNKAFVIIDLIRIGLIIVISIITILFFGKEFAENIGFSIGRNIGNTLFAIIMLIGSFISTKLFNANFYVAYEILALCQILYFEIED